MQLLRNIRAGRLKPLIAEQKEFYSRGWRPEDIRDWQLKQFNEQWQAIRRDVPFYARLSSEKKLPERFSSWVEFRASFPTIDRKEIQTNRSALQNQSKAPDYFRTTGGSTAEPIQLPAWNSEREYLDRDLWFARSWFGVAPSDKLFLIWGHSHLLGSGVKGRINGINRNAKDSLLGYCRYSAYDLSEPALRKAADALVAFRPAYLIAYAVALDRFARVNAVRQTEFHKLNLKVAIATAESFPKTDSAEIVAEVLGCPVAMEYGAVETGLLAHQKPEGRYAAFWRNYFLDGCESTSVPNAYEIFVTSLYPRCLPLIRYKIGDLISANPNDPGFGQEFEEVIGRCNDYLVMSNGSLIHSEALTHAIKECPSVLGYQVIQSAGGKIKFQYVAAASFGEPDKMEIRHRLQRINPELERISLEQVESLEQTIAGKTRRIVRESN